MCGGGGGGDGGAAKREADRQRKQDNAIADLNILFGNYQAKPAPKEKTGRIIGAAMTKGMAKRVGDVNGDGQTNYDDVLANYHQAEAGRKAKAEENNLAREGLYDRTRNDVSDYFMHDLNQQHEVANRSSRFDLARRGVAGGSSELDANANILKDYNRAVLDIGNRADSASNRLRASDEQARLDLISRIRGGMSGANAVSSAMEQLNTNIGDAKASAMAHQLGNVFASYAPIVRQNAYSRGQLNAYQNPGTFYQPTSYSGRNG